MLDVNLESYFVTGINYVNDINKSMSHRLVPTYGFSVSHYDDEVCTGEMKIDIKDEKNPDDFKMELTIVGVFKKKRNAPKEVVHLEAYNELFPYAKSIVAAITGISGTPALNIPFIDITHQEIYRMDVPPIAPKN